MPRYKLPSNMTARPSSAGRCRTTGCRCRACWPRRSRPLRASGRRQGRRAHRRRRACARPGRACRSRPGLGCRHRARRDQRASAAAPDRGAGRRDGAGDVRRALLRRPPALPLSHRQPPRRPDARSRPRLARAAPARCTRRCRRPRSVSSATHDFTTFRDTECQAKSPVKTLDQLDVTRASDEIRIEAAARSFLHTQVRSMVGSLVAVGDGRWSGDDLAAALASPRPHRLRAAGAAGGAVSRAGGILSDVTLDRNTDRGCSGRRRSALRDRRRRHARRPGAWSGRPVQIPAPGNSP